MEFLLFKFVPIASSPVPGHHWLDVYPEIRYFFILMRFPCIFSRVNSVP